MASFNEKDVIKSLNKKGFELNKKGRHKKKHKFYNFKYQNKITNVNTHFSHDSQEINDYLIGKMAHQLNLNKDQFIDLIKCPLSEEDYIKILKGQGILT